MDLAAAAARASQRNGDGSLVAPGARPSPGTAPPLELLAGDIDRELGQAGPREGTILPIVWSSQHTVSPGTAGNGLIPIGNPQGLRNEQARRSRRCDCWCRAQPHKVEVQASGPGAINQAIKAIAISRGYVASRGLDLVCIPSFITISIDGEERIRASASSSKRASRLSSET